MIPVSLLAQVAFALDLDGDGVDDAVDGCPALADPAQADADLDGFGDVCDVCEGRGAGFSAIEGPWLVRTAAVDDVVAHDLDGDGDLDAVGTRRAAQRIEVYTNLGGGVFDPAAQLAGDDVVSRVAALDADGDGDLDVVYASVDQLRWSQNVGGTFAVDLRLAQAPGVRDVVAVDVDGDGDSDLVTATATELVAYLGVGGFFVAQPAVPAVTARLEVADVDGDGDADDVLAVDAAGAWTWLGPAPQVVAALPGSAFAGAWDVDDDGLVDLVFTDATGVWAALATAPGAFAAPTAVWSDPTLNPASARPLDVDGVPPMDLVVGDAARTVVLQAEVTGGYVGWELVGGIRGLATGDFDGDGLADDVLATRSTTLDLWTPALGCGGEDQDGDGLLDAEELVIWGSDPGSPESDGDGLLDADEVAAGTSPGRIDTDGDGSNDDVDSCPVVAFEVDSDGDTVCDSVDACAGDDNLGDTDADAVCDDLDVCLGDDATGDLDGDAVCEDVDACPVVPSTLDDGDGDLRPDACDVCDGPGAGEDVLGDPASVDGILLAVGDVDGDGLPDLLTATGSSIVAWPSAGARGLEGGSSVIASVAPYAVNQVALADGDGDGDLDLYVVDGSGRVVVFEHDGATFAQLASVSTGWSTATLGAGDLDGDGFVEMGVVYANALRVFQGGPTLATTLSSAGSGAGPGFTLADHDVDGDADVWWADSQGVYVAESLGGTLAPPRIVAGGAAFGLSVVDASGDGWPDAVWSGTSTTWFALGDGTGELGDPIVLPGVLVAAGVDYDGAPPTELFLMGTSTWRVVRGVGDAVELATLGALAGGKLEVAAPGGVAVAGSFSTRTWWVPDQLECATRDTDGDGLTDAVELRESGTAPDLADTDGDGLTDGDERLTDPRLADTDGDGDADGADVCPLDPANPDADGDGVCDPTDGCPAHADPTQDDGDGDGVGDRCDLCAGLGDGRAPFTAARQLSTASAGDLALGDLDGDGVTELVAAGLDRFVRVDRAGAVTVALGAPADLVALGDVSGDGVLDLVSANGDRLVASVGDGAGGFTLPALVGVTTGAAADLVAVDLDADGAAEVARCTPAGLEVWRDPTGGWNVDDSGRGCAGVAVLDVEGDGELELASTGPDGTFVTGDPELANGDRVDTDGGEALAAGDLDGDGDDDLVVSTPFVVRVFAGGTGGLALVQELADPLPVDRRLALVDVDGDGDLDLVASNGDALTWFAQTAPRTFAAPAPLLEVPRARSLEAADVDGDGDPDLVLTTDLGRALVVPDDAACATADGDADGLTDLAELDEHGTDPRAADTDGGGALDGAELADGTDPLDPTDDVVPEPQHTGVPATHTGASATTPDPTGPGDGGGKQPGCGCDAAGPGSGAWALAALLALQARKRGGSARRRAASAR